MNARKRDVGRLVCVGIRGSTPGDALLERDLASCAEASVGGVILFDADAAHPGATRNIHSPAQVRTLVARIREKLGRDVLVCIDQEGGNVSRLHSHRGFDQGPSAAAFAQLCDEAQQQEAARQAAQLAEAGFDVNFAPCVDLALEPNSRVITQSERSYGEDPAHVIVCARRVIEAHEQAGVATCLKHFPGHGSAIGDTHRELVDITHTWERETELAPYRALLRDSDSRVAVMAAHVVHRNIGEHLPASMSRAFLDGLLRTELGFAGVVFTDSIDMRAITAQWDTGQATVLSIAAGADVVVHAFNPAPQDAAHPAPAMVETIERAVRDGTLSRGRIQTSLERIALLARKSTGAQPPQ